MAFTTTTLASAMAAGDTAMVVTSATGFAAGNKVLIDQEMFQVVNSYVSGTTIPVIRGQEGTAATAHAASANVTTGLGSDFANPGAQTPVTYAIAGKVRTVTSYSASGAIALPTAGTDAVAILNGTSALAMTLANPTKDMDGSILYIAGNGKSASTVTYTAGFGNAGSSYDVLTAQTAGQVGITLMAVNAIWVVIGGPPITGTTTALTWAIS